MNPFDSKSIVDDIIEHQESIIQFQYKQLQRQSCCFIVSLIFFSVSPFGFGVILGCLTNWFTNETPSPSYLILAQHLSGIFFGLALFILMCIVIGFVYYIYSYHYLNVHIGDKLMKLIRSKSSTEQHRTPETGSVRNPLDGTHGGFSQV